MAKSAGILKLVDETAVSSIKPWKSPFYINFIFSLLKFPNSSLVNQSSTKWNLKWTRQWIWEFRQSKSGCLLGILESFLWKGHIVQMNHMISNRHITNFIFQIWQLLMNKLQKNMTFLRPFEYSAILFWSK